MKSDRAKLPKNLGAPTMPVFISHDKEDEAAYSSVALLLKPVGYWDPEQLRAGQSLGDQLRIAVNDCEVCVFVVTRRSLASTWCGTEVGAFWGAGKPVVPFLADAEVGQDELPDHIRDTVWTRDAGQLLHAVESALKKDAISVQKRPANVFWLAHDITRAIRFAMFESQNRDELKRTLIFGLNHLREVELNAPNARSLLLRALVTIESGADLSGDQRQHLIYDIRKAKEELGLIIQGLQPEFKGYPTIEDEERLLKEAKTSVSVGPSA
jgi:hypothetical protein